MVAGVLASLAELELELAASVAQRLVTHGGHAGNPSVARRRWMIPRRHWHGVCTLAANLHPRWRPRLASLVRPSTASWARKSKPNDAYPGRVIQPDCVHSSKRRRLKQLH
jgi:hypothetical protein